MVEHRFLLSVPVKYNLQSVDVSYCVLYGIPLKESLTMLHTQDEIDLDVFTEGVVCYATHYFIVRRKVDQAVATKKWKERIERLQELKKQRNEK